MGPPDRAPRRDRQPGRPAEPLQGRAEGRRVRPERRLTTEERRFRFVQWEFPGRLGPPPGRYVVRRFAGDDVRFVIVVIESPPTRRGRHREPVSSTRVAVIDASSMPDDATAAAWLKRAAVGVEAEEIARFLSMYRVAAADPYAPDFDPARATAIRIGYGSGAQLAEGEWIEARSVEVPAAPAPKRRSKHRPTDRLAALLSGRDAILACEELTLRARADLERGRNHEAALQLEAALMAALAELAGWVTVGDLAARVDELRAQVPAVSSAADAARVGTLEPAGMEIISSALSRLEAALRARAIYGAEG